MDVFQDRHDLLANDGLDGWRVPEDGADPPLLVGEDRTVSD